MSRLSGVRMDAFVSFRSDARLLDQLRARGPKPGPIGRRDLERYYQLIRALLRTVRLSPAQARLLHDAGSLALAGNGATELSAHRLLWVAAADSTNDEGFVERIRALGVGETWALLDALECYRFALESGAEDSDELLASIGLIG